MNDTYNAGPVGEPEGIIHRSIRLLHAAIGQLGGRLPLIEVERMAILINKAMTAEARSFHTPEHVFDLVDIADPHTTLAALFHDLVYVQVDQGLLPEISDSLGPGVELREQGVRVVSAEGDRPVALCAAVFGAADGRILSPFGGMNEFLSALVMNRKLAPVLREQDLLSATASIEATIPFRGPDSAGATPAERLAGRLSAASRELSLGLDERALTRAVQGAVTFANRDVSNFADPDVARFLDNTWKLLPETNPSLRTQRVYSIRSYRIALQKMEGFMASLDPATIFGRYAGVPPDAEHGELLARASRNVVTARSYLGIKLLTAAILESLAELTGGDAPMSLFMGDIGTPHAGSQLDTYLPSAGAGKARDIDPALHDLLAHGRAGASSFDLQNSPLSRFVYERLGADAHGTHLSAARKFCAGSLGPRDFLAGIPSAVMVPVAKAGGLLAFTRRDGLEEYAASRRD
jgi:hypothetical protein